MATSPISTAPTQPVGMSYLPGTAPPLVFACPMLTGSRQTVKAWLFVMQHQRFLPWRLTGQNSTWSPGAGKKYWVVKLAMACWHYHQEPSNDSRPTPLPGPCLKYFAWPRKVQWGSTCLQARRSTHPLCWRSKTSWTRLPGRNPLVAWLA